LLQGICWLFIIGGGIGIILALFGGNGHTDAELSRNTGRSSGASHPGYAGYKRAVPSKYWTGWEPVCDLSRKKLVSGRESLDSDVDEPRRSASGRGEW
jgi:hypothetical protein